MMFEANVKVLYLYLIQKYIYPIYLISLILSYPIRLEYLFYLYYHAYNEVALQS